MWATVVQRDGGLSLVMLAARWHRRMKIPCPPWSAMVRHGDVCDAGRVLASLSLALASS